MKLKNRYEDVLWNKRFKNCLRSLQEILYIMELEQIFQSIF